jgi:hypothetical protein
MEVRYEDLATEPEREVRRVLAFVGEEFEPGVLEYHRQEHDTPAATESSADQVARPVYTSSIGRWKRDLSARELKTFMKFGAETLARLGYEV